MTNLFMLILYWANSKIKKDQFRKLEWLKEAFKWFLIKDYELLLA